MKIAKIGIVTVSDRASRGEYEDRGGPAVIQYLKKIIVSPYETCSRIVSDELELIQQTLIELSDSEQCCLLITTGGTGPAQRDITPEATTLVCQKMLPGFGEQMRQVSLAFVPTAILSRQTAGIRESNHGGCLIINLPGNPKAITECLDAVFAAIPYCIDLINGPRLETDSDHVVAFRPRNS